MQKKLLMLARGKYACIIFNANRTLRRSGVFATMAKGGNDQSTSGNGETSDQKGSSGPPDRAMAKPGWTEELNKLLPEDD